MGVILNFEKWNTLNEASINEEAKPIDLTNDSRLPKVAQQLCDQYEKGTKSPSATMGHYLFKMKPDQNYQTANTMHGLVLDFQICTFPGVGTTVSLPWWTNGFGGEFQLKPTSKFIWTATAEPFDPRVNKANFAPAEVADLLNTTMNSIPLDQLKAVYATNPNKSGFPKTIAAFKASPTGQLAVGMLTGNAKAIYDSIPAATQITAAKPGTAAPVKKN